MQSYMDAMALLLVLRCTSFFSDLNQKGIHAPKCVVQHIDAHPGVVTNCTFPIDGYIMLPLPCSEMIHWFHRWIPSFYRFVLRLHVCRHFLDGELPFCCFNTMMANSYHGRGTWRSGTGYCCAYAGQCRGSSMAMSTERCWRPGHQDPPELRSGLRSSKIW